MVEAVKKVRVYAVRGDVVILNPGFASFDYFKNFAERGEAFKDAVLRN
jgi:UDP-N-acetylmuramoylalanine--D-glutamate ligase